MNVLHFHDRRHYRLDNRIARNREPNIFFNFTRNKFSKLKLTPSLIFNLTYINAFFLETLSL